MEMYILLVYDTHKGEKKLKIVCTGTTNVKLLYNRFRTCTDTHVSSRLPPASPLVKSLLNVRTGRCENTAGDPPRDSPQASGCVETATDAKIGKRGAIHTEDTGGAATPSPESSGGFCGVNPSEWSISCRLVHV